MFQSINDCVSALTLNDSVSVARHHYSVSVLISSGGVSVLMGKAEPSLDISVCLLSASNQELYNLCPSSDIKI